jgi:hypothetical protein
MSATSVSSLKGKKNSLRQTKSTTAISISRIFCSICDEFYSKKYFSQHKKTKKHQFKNAEKAVKDEEEEGDSDETVIDTTP